MKKPNFGIQAVDANGRVVEYFSRQIDAREKGYCQQSISECLRGRRAKHRGLTWRRADVYCKLYEFAKGRRPFCDARPVVRAYIDSLPPSWRPFVDEAEAIRIITD